MQPTDDSVRRLPDPKTVFLPLEVWHIILSYLLVADLKSARLVCRTWGHVGERYLFQPAFVLWPHRKDLERLVSVSRISHLAAGIETLKFSTGAFGPTTRLIIGGRLRAETNVTASADALSAAASELKNWRRERRSARQNYNDRKILTKSISRLKNLHYLEVCVTACPWQSPVLQEAWQERFGENKDQEVMEFMNLLMAAKSASSKILTLKHDGLDAKFLELSAESLSQVSAALMNLQKLHLVFNTSSGSWSLRRAGLGQFLRYAPELQDLRIRCNPLTWGWGAPGESFHLWSRCLQDQVWPHLRILHLDGFLSDEHDLFNLLEKHASTLHQLQLRNIVLYQGSFRTLFTNIKQHLHLLNFAVGGVINAWHLDEEKWDFDKPSSPELCPEIFEEFVIRGGIWPMPASNFQIPKQIPHWNVALQEAEFCDMPYERRHLWSFDSSNQDVQYTSDVDYDSDD